ncbi:hypothetical protein [Trujillonella humicola]|uniref:hypothetical protein n=1 Tax=Trujillonella humicola TaxID=3383699 RepID=UPI003906A5EB
MLPHERERFADQRQVGRVARPEGDPLAHGGAAAVAERRARAVGDQLLHPGPWQLQDQRAADGHRDGHRDDRAVGCERGRAEPARAGAGGLHAGLAGEGVGQGGEAALGVVGRGRHDGAVHDVCGAGR